jgi:hypothetical protein
MRASLTGASFVHDRRGSNAQADSVAKSSLYS